MLKTAVFELMQQFYNATEIGNVVNAVSASADQQRGTVFSRTAWTISLFVYYIHRSKNAHYISQAYQNVRGFPRS